MSFSHDDDDTKEYQGRPVVAFWSEAGTVIKDKHGLTIAPTSTFSNFYATPIQVRPGAPILALMDRIRGDTVASEAVKSPVTFWSTEALWQSLKADNATVFNMFHSGGLLDRFRASDLIGDRESEVLAFFAFVSAKKEKRNAKGRVSPAKTRQEVAVVKRDYWSRKKMVGIITKMAANPTYASRLAAAPYHIPKGSMRYEREKLAPSLEEEFWVSALVLKFTQNLPLKEALLSTGDAYLLEFDRAGGRSNQATPPYWGGMIHDDGRLVGENKMGQYLMKARSAISKLPWAPM